MIEQVEYITVDEAVKCSGLSEKTLREKLRGQVPMIGSGSWLRDDFFKFWANEHNRKLKGKKKDIQISAGKALARQVSGGRIPRGTEAPKKGA